jgi:hypothetical protein
MVGVDSQAYSIDNGLTWTSVASPLVGGWYSVAFGDGVFVMVGDGLQGYSTDNGLTWTSVASPLVGSWRSVAFGDGVFVMIRGDSQAYSTDNGLTWTTVASPLFGQWNGVAFGNGVFVMVGIDSQAYSTDDGLTWSYVASPLAGVWNSVTFENGVFVMVGIDSQAYSTDNGLTWTSVASPLNGPWSSVTFGNGVFVMIGLYFVVQGTSTGTQAYSTDNGQTWTMVTPVFPQVLGDVAFGNGVFVTVYWFSQARSTTGQTWTQVNSILPGYWYGDIYGEFTYINSLSDSVSLLVYPLELSNRVFSSDVYPSISFANAADAAFWGFDAREGLTYELPATPPWTLTQSGWISGFLPPSTSTYDDSVAHKLCKAVRILVGKQTIKEYSGEYIELQNDLLVPYENKAILKLMNGTLDQTQATVAREYYVNLPIGTKEVPLCALTHQNMSVEIDFDLYQNLSQNLNQGTGDFLDSKSYRTYDASTGILAGQPVNVQTTFSYQQYIFVVTYDGIFIVYDTTKSVTDPVSYTVISGFSDFKQFCVLSGNLYIGLNNGQIARMILSELVQGNISSFVVNNYVPTIGSLTGTVVADFRYMYYAVSNTATSNVFVTKYDTTGVFTNPTSYTTVDFTKTFNSSVDGVYQFISTGTELVMLPQGTPGNLYTYQLNANVQSQWYVLNYSYYGNQITEGVLLGDSLYFVIDNFNILKYSNFNFDIYTFKSYFVMVARNNQAYSEDNGKSWSQVTSPINGVWYDSEQGGNGNFSMVAFNNLQAYSIDNGQSWDFTTLTILYPFICIAYGNGVFVAGGNSVKARSTDNGRSWTPNTSPSYNFGRGVTFGNGVFVMVGQFDSQEYSSDNGLTWTSVASPLVGTWIGVAFGNGVFVMIGFDSQAYSTDNGLTWTTVAYPLTGLWNSVAFGNGVFVMVGIDDSQAYSTDNGLTWTTVASSLVGTWNSVAFGNGVFIMVGGDSQAYSIDNGLTWITVASPLPSGDSMEGGWKGLSVREGVLIPGDRLKNLIAVGNYIYCSTSNVAVQIDTTQDLSTAAAYTFPAPLPVNNYVFANGPRYVYMFAQGDNTATNIVEFDPYGPDTTFKASILVDYESLPREVPKPDKALLGLVQTQKVTDMNYMNIKGPVKELWVTGVSARANVFQYSNLATRSTLEIAGEQIVTDDVGTRTFFNIIEPFETHTSVPIRNVSVVSFEFDPEREIPNGTINFSRIRDQIFEGGAQTVWASNYNLLKIQGGIGGLIFNS